jgi:hypothetical protein
MTATRTRPATTVLRERPIAATLLTTMVLLNVANAIAIAVGADGSGRWLLLGLERNPSTWFSAVLLLLAGALAGVVGVGRADERHWRVVAGLLALLSLDEVATFHEKLGGVPVLPGIGNRAWAGAGLALAGLVAWRLLPWALRLERDLRFALLAGGCTFVAGSLGFEVAAATRPSEDSIFWILSSIEENLEMLGVYVVVRMLLAHLRTAGRTITVAVGGDG